VHAMGRAAAELILSRINGDRTPVHRIVLPVELAERGSVEPPPPRTQRSSKPTPR
jgi:LacI family transcriptional regulator